MDYQFFFSSTTPFFILFSITILFILIACFTFFVAVAFFFFLSKNKMLKLNQKKKGFRIMGNKSKPMSTPEADVAFDQTWDQYARQNLSKIALEHHKKYEHALFVQRVINFKPGKSMDKVKEKMNDKEMEAMKKDSKYYSILQLHSTARTYLLYVPQSLLENEKSEVEFKPLIKSDEKEQQEDGLVLTYNYNASSESTDTHDKKQHQNYWKIFGEKKKEPKKKSSKDKDQQSLEPQVDEQTALKILLLLHGTDESVFDCELLRQEDGEMSWLELAEKHQIVLIFPQGKY
ncbi:hypothetical protein RFI_01055 [Reticulomyxa filosa]|uniref:Uncharacterized protein n=1 Tax=Reticulomyxa filosa TaxID=46433 RepID=X6PCS0_RETFI|nr:hypothetical protein RFI_01055 [Reticulomyxa filosa]|eukprot:ETO36006.1 hypothetical protein RFI_01055 [Reticulomyxa filosa]